jgi:two-component system, NarL family, response regulator
VSKVTTGCRFDSSTRWIGVFISNLQFKENQLEVKKSRAIRVLIAHSKLLVLDGLRYWINEERDMRAVGQATSAHEAFQNFLTCQPDVAVLDLGFHQNEGLDVVLAIRQRSALASIIAIAARDSNQDIYRLLRSGIRAVLFEDTTRPDMLRCIRAVHAGQVILPATVARKLPAPLADSVLTPRERTVLDQILRGKSNKEIAANLHLSEGTIKTHVNHVLRRLGVGGRLEACTEALRRGLVHLK